MVGHRALLRSSTAMMPSAGTLCQLLALGLLVETRLELATQNDDTARRSLDDGASCATVAHTEALVADRVEAAVAEMRGELDRRRSPGNAGPRERDGLPRRPAPSARAQRHDGRSIPR